jgi:hypothetical protein
MPKLRSRRCAFSTKRINANSGDLDSRIFPVSSILFNYTGRLPVSFQRGDNIGLRVWSPAVLYRYRDHKA